MKILLIIIGLLACTSVAEAQEETKELQKIRVGKSKFDCLSRGMTFRPNGGSGLNETWQIQCISLSDYDNSVTVFNRWGLEIFRADNYDGSWDGTMFQKVKGRKKLSKRVDCPSGIYSYSIEIREPSRPAQTITGTLTIMR